MVGSVGVVRSMPRSNSLVIQDALNLLAAFGSDSEGTTKKLLMEIKDAQDHNEVVLANAVAEGIKCNKRDVEVAEKENKLALDLKEAEELCAERLSGIISGEEELQRRVEEEDNRISVENENINTRKEEFHNEEKRHLESLRISEGSLVERERILKEDRNTLKELESSIEGREEDIKSDKITLDDLRGFLDDLRGSLDKRKVDLDNRDARVLAAMEGESVVEGE